MSRSVGEYIFSNLSSLTVWFISQCKDGQPNEALGWAEVESGFGSYISEMYALCDLMRNIHHMLGWAMIGSMLPDSISFA